jgi:hypothetical protein
MMESGFGLPGSCGKVARKQSIISGLSLPSQEKYASADELGARLQSSPDSGAVRSTPIPAGVRESVALSHGEYDARRLRSQREVIRDVMLAAASCDTWLTLGELRALTRYGEASISAQLRHLRKMENGGYEVVKRHRVGVAPVHPGTDGRGDFVWEYRVSRIVYANEAFSSGEGNESDLKCG